MLDIKIKKLNKNVQLPKQSTQGAAGMDFYLPQPVRFEPNRSKKVPHGLTGKTILNKGFQSAGEC